MIEKTYPITEKLLGKGLALCQKLLELLSQEAENLKNNTTPETISALADSKKETVDQLEQFSKQLSQILATENLSLENQGIDNYFQKAQNADFQTSDALAQWQEISRISKQCQSFNEKNGASIDLLMRHNQRSLQILRGKSELESTYGPDGSTNSAKHSHSQFSV